VVGSEQVAGRLGEPGYADLDTVLRAFVPGEAPAQVTVRVIPEDATLAGASFDLLLDAGIVTDVPIEGLVDGSYSVVVESTVPVVAAMRVSTVAAMKVGATPAGASDAAWFAAATALADSAFATVASGPGATLHLANPGEVAATVTISGDSVSVPAGSSVTVEVTGGESVLIEGADGLFASISFRSPGHLASYPVSSTASGEAPLTVYRG